MLPRRNGVNSAETKGRCNAQPCAILSSQWPAMVGMIRGLQDALMWCSGGPYLEEVIGTLSLLTMRVTTGLVCTIGNHPTQYLHIPSFHGKWPTWMLSEFGDVLVIFSVQHA